MRQHRGDCRSFDRVRIARVLAMLVLVAAAPGKAGLVMAHSWYPRHCCNELDCVPVDRIEHLPTGGMRLTAGHIEVIVPPGFPVMASADARAHVCTYRNMAGHYLPRCVFLPGVS